MNQITLIFSTLLFVVAISLCLMSTSAQSQRPTRGRPSLTPKLKSNESSSSNNTIKPPKNTLNGTTTTRGAVSNLQERSVATNNNNNGSSANGRLSEFVEDELPADFYEMPPEQLDLGMNATGRAPVPILNVAVLQNGKMIDSAINVHPGTPLEMVIYLDDKSAKVYGLFASYLKVQDDTFRQREEVIISNGCSLDTYIFGNFEHDPEDQSLRAKFRAFKFPDSNFVRFVGTVNVCIKQCAKVNCGGSGGGVGGGGVGTRKKRATNKDNGLVMTVSTVLRIGAFIV